MISENRGIRDEYVVFVVDVAAKEPGRKVHRSDCLLRGRLSQTRVKFSGKNLVAQAKAARASVRFGAESRFLFFV